MQVDLSILHWEYCTKILSTKDFFSKCYQIYKEEFLNSNHFLEKGTFQKSKYMFETSSKAR